MNIKKSIKLLKNIEHLWFADFDTNVAIRFAIKKLQIIQQKNEKKKK